MLEQRADRSNRAGYLLLTGEGVIERVRCIDVLSSVSIRGGHVDGVISSIVELTAVDIWNGTRPFDLADREGICVILLDRLTCEPFLVVRLLLDGARLLHSS